MRLSSLLRTWAVGTQGELSDYVAWYYSGDKNGSIFNAISSTEFVIGVLVRYYSNNLDLVNYAGCVLVADSLARLAGFAVNVAKDFPASRDANPSGNVGEVIMDAYGKALPAPGLVGRVRELAVKAGVGRPRQ